MRSRVCSLQTDTSPPFSHVHDDHGRSALTCNPFSPTSLARLHQEPQHHTVKGWSKMCSRSLTATEHVCTGALCMSVSGQTTKGGTFIHFSLWAGSAILPLSHTSEFLCSALLHFINITHGNFVLPGLLGCRRSAAPAALSPGARLSSVPW